MNEHDPCQVRRYILFFLARKESCLFRLAEDSGCIGMLCRDQERAELWWGCNQVPGHHCTGTTHVKCLTDRLLHHSHPCETVVYLGMLGKARRLPVKSDSHVLIPVFRCGRSR